MRTSLSRPAEPSILARELKAPGFLEEAADLAVAALALCVLEWRAGLKWALAFGVPKTILVIALGSEHSAHIPSQASHLAIGLLVMALFEPFVAAFAFLYLKARSEGALFRPEDAWGSGRARYGALFLLCLAVEAGALAAGLPFLPFSRSALTAPVGYVGSVLAGTLLRVWFLTAAPRMVLETSPARTAVARSIADARADFRTVMAALILLIALNVAFADLATSPNVFADSPLCGLSDADAATVAGAASCSVWWRSLYLWLGQWLGAPYYGLAFLVYARRSSTAGEA